MSLSKLSLIIFLIVFNLGFGNNNSTLAIINNHLIDSTTYIPPKAKTEIYFQLDDLYDVEIKNSFFHAKFFYELNTKKDELLLSTKIIDDSKSLVELQYWDSPISRIGEWVNISDAISDIHFRSLKARFDHNWDVGNYPFDNPQLKVIFKSTQDTSLHELVPSEKLIFPEKIENLKDGFSLESINTKKDYIVVRDDVNKGTNKVLERLIFIISLKRDSFWLYLKLFLGSFLAWIISWLVFFIPKEEFTSRIELSVGAIFGAVGNRAYVESIMPDVQVLTRADVINNTLIFLIIFNIIIFMVQRNEKIKWLFFEDNQNAAIYTAYILIVLNSAIVIWSLL